MIRKTGKITRRKSRTTIYTEFGNCKKCGFALIEFEKGVCGLCKEKLGGDCNV